MLKKLFRMRHSSRIRNLVENGVKIGEQTVIFNKAEDFGIHPHLISIGKHCVITSGVKFVTNPAATRYNYDTGDKRFQSSYPTCITIHDNSFLGIDSIIYPGVSIGPNSIVGAGAVVTEDVPENTCASGNPCRVSCNAEMYKRMSKRGIIGDYSRENKREILVRHFWKKDEIT